MRKLIWLPLTLTATSLLAADNTNDLYDLSNQTMDIVTKMKEFPSDGHFQLTPNEADLVMNLAKNDYMIGEHLASKNEKKPASDCPEENAPDPKLNKAYNERSFRVSAISVFSLSDFAASERKIYADSAYSNFMTSKGYTVSAPAKYSWSSLMSRFTDYDKNADAGTNAKKLAELIKSETGLEVPSGALASEFIYRDLLARPNDWNTTLTKSKDSLSFDEKVYLVAKLGGNFGSDYNYSRAAGSSSGIVPIEVMLKNFSTAESGGICRDVSLAQTQMLKALGVDQAYSVTYSYDRGGHATVLAVDPNNKNRIIKFNYGELYTDDGKKGTAVLDQNNSLPNVGMQYRVYDDEGKPLAAIPSEIGQILKEVTNQPRQPGDSVRSYALNKVFFENEQVSGSLFTGKTSTGEVINGLALNKSMNSEGLHAEFGGALYVANADKKYYDMNEHGLYGFAKMGFSTTIYEGKHGHLGGEIGMNTEVLFLGGESTAKNYPKKYKIDTFDVSKNFYAKTNYENQLNEKDKVGVSVEVKTRIDKSNVADEGSQSLQYDSTTIISRYDHQFSSNLKSSVQVANLLARYGNNVSFQATLEDQQNKFSVSGNVPVSNAPSFFPGQERSLAAVYERNSKSGWNFKLEYQKNLDSGADQFMGTASKKF